MYVNNEVSLKLLYGRMSVPIICADNYFKSIGIDLVITSGNDEVHMTNSLHYDGKAIDIQTNTMSFSQQLACIYYLRKHLDFCFDILMELDHIHIEFDENLPA
jgi:hypothetical protein